MISKKTIRRDIRAQRRQLSEVERQQAGLKLLARLRCLRLFLCAKKISVYLANDGELPLNFTTDFIWNRNKTCYLPVLFGKNSRKMHFAPYTSKTLFNRNRYGIPEPDVNFRQQSKPWQLDLVLMPLVAFDLGGNRLGMGGGFYDKTFSYLRFRKRWRKPRLIGVAYDFQEIEKIPEDPWDVPLDYIVTETRIIRVIK